MVTTNAQREAFEQSNRDRLQSAKCLLATFDRLDLPDVMYDFGCGPGHLVKVAQSLGVIAIGFDICIEDMSENGLLCADLCEPIKIPEKADLVVCWEVAEHLPASAADTLCESLAGATGRWLVFSAATPGQGGAGHVNEQPHLYWLDKFAQHGMRVSNEMTRLIRQDFKRAAPGAWWYGKNALVFEGEGR